MTVSRRLVALRFVAFVGVLISLPACNQQDAKSTGTKANEGELRSKAAEAEAAKRGATATAPTSH